MTWKFFFVFGLVRDESISMYHITLTTMKKSREKNSGGAHAKRPLRDENKRKKHDDDSTLEVGRGWCFPTEAKFCDEFPLSLSPPSADTFGAKEKSFSGALLAFPFLLGAEIMSRARCFSHVSKLKRLIYLSIFIPVHISSRVFIELSSDKRGGDQRAEK